MKISDIAREALANLRRNKLRTFATIVGVMAGTAALVFFVSLGFGLRAIVMDKIATMDELRVIEVGPGQTKDRITEDDAGKIERMGYVSDVSPIKAEPAKAKVSGGVSTDMIVYGVYEKYLAWEKVKLIAGRLPAGERELVVSRAVLTNLSPTAKTTDGKIEPIKVVVSFGDEKTRENVGGTIVGVSDDAKAAYAYATDKFVPYKNFSSLKVQSDTIGNANVVRKALDAQGYTTASIADTMGTVNDYMKGFIVALGLIGVNGLIVGSIMVFMVMMLILFERTRAVGIMKALGVSAKDINRMFMVEAAIIGALGGILGVTAGRIVGLGVDGLVNAAALWAGGETGVHFLLPYYISVALVLFTTLVAMAAGVYPAKRAAKIQPIEALRYE